MEIRKQWVYHDGGRAEAGFEGIAGDCFTRAVAIATGKPYREIYDLVDEISKGERRGKRKRKVSKASAGVFRYTADKVLKHLGGFRWVPTMKVGSGCRVHLRSEELPSGTLIVRVSRHICTVIDGVLYDTHDCSRNGTRCVYGYHEKISDFA